MVRGLKLHAMRNLRMKLKSGFMKEEPADYIFMKRYPPLHRDDRQNFHKLKPTEVPYVELYEKAVARNPLYDDERVYPAYWNQEPQALTLAKKQYEHIQAGLDEESAYQKAIAFINELENESFLELEKVSEAFTKMGAKAPFMTVPSIAAEINKFRAMLKGVSFLDLDLADQGEIDYLLQVKILQWNEVARERRMKDPVFESLFSKFRESIFPTDARILAEEKKFAEERDRAIFFDLADVDPEKLSYREPFFVEDYIMHFERVRDEPDLRKWSSDNRASLSRWIVDSLALQEIVDSWDGDKVQDYLNNLRVHFFPMIHFPDRAMDFEVPTVESVKKVLFENDIGYKRVDGKLFVRRAYHLPMLLFPQETLAAKEADDEREAENRKREELEAKNSMKFSDEYAISKDEIRQHTGNYGRQEDSMALLDDILKDSFRVDDSVAIKSNASRLAGRENGDEEFVEEREDSGEAGDLVNYEEDNKRFRHQKGPSVYPEPSTEPRENMTDVQWERLKSQYYTTPVTELEKEREKMITDVSDDDVEDNMNESDLVAFRSQRLELQIIGRARLNLRYENKEAARRSREWKTRGVWIDNKMPKPSLQVERHTKKGGLKYLD